MNKLEVITNPESCLNKAADDEPLFVLRGKDPLYAAVVRYWANIADGVHEPEKIIAAYREAQMAERWRIENFPSESDK